MSKVPKMMSFKLINRCKIVFGYLRLSFYAVNVVLMHKIGTKYQYACRAVCAFPYDFRK